MKRNRMMRIASFLLIAVLATTCAISGTFAKYTSDFTGSDTARIAKWDIKLGSVAGASTEQTFTFNLFDTINDTLGGGTADETDVADDRIAPGTTGSVSVTLTNSSEVNAQYTVKLVQTSTTLPGGATLPIEYKIGDNEWTTVLGSATAPITVLKGQDAPITIQWRWAYEGTTGDVNDTLLGLAGNIDVTLAVTVNVTQVD